jgi:hypothetical protein
MKYAAEMGSGAMMYIPSFIKIGSVIITSIGGTHKHTNRMVIAETYFHFFQKKENVLKRGEKN